MSRRGATLLLGSVLLALLAIGSAKLPVPYAILGPGPTVNTVGKYEGKPVITVTGRPVSSSKGHLNLTTVSVTDNITLLQGMRAWFDRSYAVVPRESVFPPDQTTKQVDAANAAEFRSSQNSAELAAMAELHYPLQVVVSEVKKDAAVHGVLRAGDVIAAVDGIPVTTGPKLTAQIRAKSPGDPVTIRYLRGGNATVVTVRTGKLPDDPKRAALGVLVEQKPAAPLKISFDINNIGGPSAGLMFSLGIVDFLTPADLTGGRFIAGTGTIDDTGKVGPIGGIHQKLVAARAAGATVFLTPADNCAEARNGAPSGLRLVKVTSLHDALSSLDKVRSGDSALPSCG
ncbi:MAG: PDZ domain-containing protein [Mycobacteriales bacterium]